MNSVRWARVTRGVRKVGTALAMASTPVSAEQPDENALRTSSRPRVSCAGKDCAVPTTAAGWERRRPTATIPRTATMNSRVGSISTRALSVTPRRFTAVSSARPTRHTTSLSWAREGKAEASASAPAVRLTQTVST